MDIRQALQVLGEKRPQRTDEYGQETPEWRTDRNRRKAARRLLATGKTTTSAARKAKRNKDVMRFYVTGIAGLAEEA